MRVVREGGLYCISCEIQINRGIVRTDIVSHTDAIPCRVYTAESRASNPVIKPVFAHSTCPRGLTCDPHHIAALSLVPAGVPLWVVTREAQVQRPLVHSPLSPLNFVSGVYTPSLASPPLRPEEGVTPCRPGPAAKASEAERSHGGCTGTETRPKSSRPIPGSKWQGMRWTNLSFRPRLGLPSHQRTVPGFSFPFLHLAVKRPSLFPPALPRFLPWIECLPSVRLSLFPEETGAPSLPRHR